jgi:hypothetical protein
LRPGSPRPSRQGRTPSPGTRPSIPYGARSRPSSGTASCARTHSRTSRSADAISRTSTRPFARTRGVAGRGGIPPRRGCDDSWSSSTTRRCFARARAAAGTRGSKFARWRGGWIPRSHARGQPTRAPKRKGTHEEGEGIHKKYPHGSDAEATAEGALWIYRVAFDELTSSGRVAVQGPGRAPRQGVGPLLLHRGDARGSAVRRVSHGGEGAGARDVARPRTIPRRDRRTEHSASGARRDVGQDTNATPS